MGWDGRDGREVEAPAAAADVVVVAVAVAATVIAVSFCIVHSSFAFRRHPMGPYRYRPFH
jgi:hypothetical protein